MADVAFAPTTSVTMNANKSVTANFIAGVKITVNKDGQGTVSPGTGIYPAGGTKVFTATPASGWRWSHWEGNLGGADGGDPSLDLPMDQSRTITAVFVEQVTLTMVKELIGNLPAEGGTVSPAVGETLHDKDSVVNLVATPDGGWRFKQWSGAASGTNPSTTVTMSGDKTVTATFIQRHTVTTEVIEQGLIEPEGGTYDHGTTQSFFFDRQSGHQFHHWAGLPSSFSTPAWGPGTSTSNPVNVTIEQSLHIIGYDDEIIYTLTADVDAEGCTGCTVDPPVAEYIEGDPGTVTATPGAGWGFVRWEGNVPAEMVEDNPLVMPMNGDKAVTAVFGQVTLTMDTEEGGTVDPDVGVHYYAQGDLAFITATADEGWKFDRWEGNVPSADIRVNPLNLEMNEDKDVTAVFHVRLDVEAPPTVTVSAPISLPFSWYMPGDTVQLTATPVDEDHVVAFWEVTTFYPESEGSRQALSGGTGGDGNDKTIYPGAHATFSIVYPSRAVPIVRPAGTFSLMVESRWVAGQSVGHVNVEASADMVGAPVDLGEGRMIYTFNQYRDLVSNPPERVEVSLEAEANEAGWGFVGWEGDIVPYSPETNPIMLTMDANKAVVANFADFEVDVTLMAIRFTDTAEIRAYPGNERLDNGLHYSIYPPDTGPKAPVRYGFDSKPTMDFEVWVEQCAHPEILVRAKVGKTILGQEVYSVGSPPNLVAMNELGGTVKIPRHDKIGGQTTAVSLQGSVDDGATWFKIGSGGPSKWYVMPDTNTLGEIPYDLTLDKNVAWAEGLSAPNAILSAISNGIAKDVHYDPGEETPPGHILRVYDIGKAQCSTNVLLMIHHSKVAGVDADMLYLWGGSDQNTLEMYFYNDGIYTYGVSFRASVGENEGAPAYPHFSFHALTVSDGVYYDPSYGTIGLTNFDEFMPPYSGAFNVPPLPGQPVITPAQQTGTFLPWPGLETNWVCPH